VIAKEYWFPESLTSVMCCAPPPREAQESDESQLTQEEKVRESSNDVSTDLISFGTGNTDQDKNAKSNITRQPKFRKRREPDAEQTIAIPQTKLIALPEKDNHYSIASNIINYQSIHVGKKCMLS